MSSGEHGSLTTPWFAIEAESECMVTPAEAPGEDPATAYQRHFDRARARIVAWLGRASAELEAAVRAAVAAVPAELTPWTEENGSLQSIEFRVDVGFGYRAVLKLRCSTNLPVAAAQGIADRAAEILTRAGTDTD